MKVIHTSDWHIGRFFQNIALLDDQLYILEQLKKLIKKHQVDVLLISGDIFDRSVPPADAVDILNRYLDDITTDLGVIVIMISGNHDSSKRLGFGARQMKKSGLYILSRLDDVDKPVVVDKGGQTVHFYGIPYHEPVEVSECFHQALKTHDDAHTYLVNKISSTRQKGIPAVLLSHCFISGGQTSESERPLSIGGVETVSWEPLQVFDYVALGHLHGPQSKGQEHIRYSGSLLKYSFSEYKQQKGVRLLEINQEGLVSSEDLELKPRHDLRIIKGRLEEIIEAGKTDPHPEDYLQINLTDEQAILDPMGRLRQVYPNVLQIERSNFTPSDSIDVKSTINNERDEATLFSDFFSQVMGQELNEAQLSILHETIKEARAINQSA